MTALPIPMIQGKRAGRASIRVLPAALEKDATRRKIAVIADEAAVLGRENVATGREEAALLRENAAGLREDSAHLREGVVSKREEEALVREDSVTSRERDSRAAEALQATADEHLIILQQTNARLVVATIEAHELAEQVQAARDQMDHFAHHDALTGLPNRMLLQDRLGRRSSRPAVKTGNLQ